MPPSTASPAFAPPSTASVTRCYCVPGTPQARSAADWFFAADNQGCRDWSIPWPPQHPASTDPHVWLTEDPWHDENPERILEAEPLSRFLLQFTLHEASGIAPFNAWTLVMPVNRLEPLWDFLRPVPLSPFLPTYGADRFYAAPGLLASVSVDENQATVAFGALHRETLASLRRYDFPWARFDE
ncbi:hypothetical protein [Streptomyces kanasensis]|uniref:Uncharacterized protein n=1 Tax=Streptomyces kanasensis TaxID=936756 RepID=A0A100Y2B3_9ACTN|nr:hypothetical protein [Streptomyces kanasensis]KUH36389.1 hypothetical protein ATE80_23730 [Streptomyces kanasensis]